MIKIYNLVTFFYNLIFTIFENIIFRKKINKNEFTEKGYLKFYNLKNIKIDFKESENIIVNKYYKKIILLNNELNELIYSILIENKLHEKISNKTGFNYSIDFFTAYETSSILEEDQNKGWYANHPHRDKPYSKNTIKLIIPMQSIRNEHGPMRIIDKIKSKKFNPTKKYNFENVTCETGQVFLFNPNICYHYASNPNKGENRRQMMFQLNPSKNWCINQKIFEYQNKREPKFPFFSYLFNSKKHLGLSSL